MKINKTGQKRPFLGKNVTKWFSELSVFQFLHMIEKLHFYLAEVCDNLQGARQKKQKKGSSEGEYNTYNWMQLCLSL